MGIVRGEISSFFTTDIMRTKLVLYQDCIIHFIAMGWRQLPYQAYNPTEGYYINIEENSAVSIGPIQKNAINMYIITHNKARELTVIILKWFYSLI